MADSLQSSGAPIRIEYVSRPGLGRLALVNVLLNLVALTIYRFWAKTNVRRHIWSGVHINGQALEYTGQGIELFKGALIVFGLFVLPFVLVIAFINIALGPEHPALLRSIPCCTLQFLCCGEPPFIGRGAINFRALCGGVSGERWWDLP